MMKRKHITHSALPAIAAVLALGSTHAVAQDIASESSPVAVPLPDVPATTSAAQPANDIVIPGQQPSVVLPVPSVTLPPVSVQPPAEQSLLSPPVSEPEPAAVQPAPAMERDAPAEEASAPAERTVATEPVSTRAAAPEREPVADSAAMTPAATPEPEMQIAPAALPDEAPAMPAAEPAAPVEETTASDPSSWALIGGAGAALLLGAGFYAFRRRRSGEEPVEARAVVTPRSPATAAPLPAANPLPAAIAPRAAPMASRERFAELEAMVAAPVSRDNPFLTRRNRLRRAHFIQQHGHAPVAATMTSPPAPAMAPASAPAVDQMVYSFGRPATAPSGSRKPVRT